MNTPRSKSIVHFLFVFALLVSLLGSAIAVTPAYAATLSVTNTNDSGAGSLRQAIADAAPNDTIIFDSSLLGATIHLASTLILSQNVTINGSALAVPVTISGDSDSDGVGDVTIFMIDPGVTVVINSLVLTKGNAVNDNGGAISNNGTLTITNSSLVDNHAQDSSYSGGAVYSSNSLTMSNSTFLNNTAPYGGGAIQAVGTLNISNSTFSYNYTNSGGGGGAIYSAATTTITASTFTHNTASTVNGGGIYVVNGTTTVTGSTFAYNSAGGGASIAVQTGTLNVSNSTFTQNTTAGIAGGIYNYGTVNLYNSTFSDNAANVGADIASFGTLNFANNIMANSITALSCYKGAGTIGTNINNLIEDTSPTCSPTLTSDPLLGSLAYNGGPTQTMAPLPGSPAIDAGDNATCAAAPVSNLDQRGAARPFGPQCDIGAVEYTTTYVVTNANDPGDGTCDSTCSLRDAINAANADADGDTILFDGDYTIYLASSLPTTSDDLTIDGRGHNVVIDGSNSYQILQANDNLYLKNLTLQRGSGANGGALLTNDTTTISNVTFVNNTAANNAGAVYNNQASLDIQNSTFRTNSAGNSGGGGAIKNDAGTLTISNSTFSGNSASVGGAIIALNGATTTVRNSTFSGNSASSQAAGIYNNGTLNYANTIIANSSGGDCVNDGGLGINLNNLVEDGSCSTTLSGDPSLGSLANNGGSTQTFALLAGSTAIDAGNDAVCLTAATNRLDQRGYPRQIGGHCDIGSYEYNPPPVVSSIVRVNSNPTNATSVDYTVTFSEPVTGVDSGDFTITTLNLTGASITGLSGSGTSYIVSVNTGSGNGDLTLKALDNNSILDNLGDPLGGPGATDGDFTGETYTVDKTGPSVINMARANTSPTNAASVDFTVTFSEPITGVNAADFSLTATGITGASVTGISGSGTTRTVSVNTGSGSGTIRLDLVDDDTIVDTAANPLGGAGTGNGSFASGEIYTIDKTGPTVASITRANANPTSLNSVDFAVTFSEPVTGVDAADFGLTTTGSMSSALISSVSGSGKTYTVTVAIGSGAGTIRLDVTDNDSIADATSNRLGGTGVGNGAFTNGEVYTKELYRIYLPLVVR